MRSLFLFIPLSILLLTACGNDKSKENIDLPDLIPYREGKVWGFADTTGKAVITPRYDSVSFFYHGIAKVHLRRDDGKKIGFIDEQGKEIVPPVYDDMPGLNWKDNLRYLLLRKNGLYGVVSRKGKEIVPCKYHSIDFSQDGYFLVELETETDTRYGVYDSTGKAVFEPIYKMIQSRLPLGKKNLFSVAYNEKFGLFDNNGNPLTEFKYPILVAISSNNAAYGNPMDFGLMDDQGREITPIMYYDLDVINDSLYIVGNRKTGKRGVINRYGRVVLDYNYNYITKAGRERLRLTSFLNSRMVYGLADLSGKAILPVEYDYMLFTNGIFITGKNGLYGAADSSGHQLVPIKYKSVRSLNKNFVTEDSAGHYGVFNEQGKRIIKHEYDYISEYRDTLIRTSKKGKYRYFYPDGREVPPLTMYQQFYDSAVYIDAPDGIIVRQELPNNRFVVSKAGRFYFTDHGGKLDKSKDFDSIFRFHEGVAKFKEGDRFGLVDSNGVVLAKPEYTDIKPFSGGAAIVTGLNKEKQVYYGLLDRNGKLVADIIYDNISLLKPGLFAAYGPDKKFLGYIDFRGNVYFKDPK